MILHCKVRPLVVVTPCDLRFWTPVRILHSVMDRYLTYARLTDPWCGSMVRTMPRNTSLAMQAAVNDYLQGLPLAAKTISSRRCSLAALLKITGPSILVSSVTERHIHDMFVANTHWRESTRGLNQTNIKLFFEWCRDMNYAPMNWNPLRARRARRSGGEVREHRYLSTEEMVSLLDATPYARDRALAAAAWFTMCRSIELKMIRVRHVDLDKGHVWVRITKTGKEAKKPIEDAWRPMLIEWMNFYEESLRENGTVLRPDHFLFPARDVFPLTARGPGGKYRNDGQTASRLRPASPISDIHSLFSDILTNAGITGEWIGGHTFRRSAAREMFFRLRGMGEDVDSVLFVLRIWLNHSSTVITQKYIGLAAGEDMQHQLFHRDGNKKIPMHPAWVAALSGESNVVVPIFK